MVDEKQTTIYLSFKEAELFKKFLQYENLWERVFKIKDGSVELFIDSQGVISKIGYNQVERVIHIPIGT